MQVLHIFWPDLAFSHSQFRSASLKFRSGYKTGTSPLETDQPSGPLAHFGRFLQVSFANALAIAHEEA